MTETKYIIALCPATPTYLVKQDVPANRMFSRSAATVAAETTRVKAEALVFDTFDAAMEVARDITGWGGAQRVEQIAVEVAPTIIVAARNPHDTEARDWQPAEARIICNNTLTPWRTPSPRPGSPCTATPTPATARPPSARRCRTAAPAPS